MKAHYIKLPEWLHNQWGIFLELTGLVMVVYTATMAITYKKLPEFARLLLSNLPFVSLSLFGTLAARRASLSLNIPGQLQRTWKYLTAAIFCLFLGDLAHFFQEFILGNYLERQLSSSFLLAFLFLTVAGLLSIPDQHLTRRQNLTCFLNLSPILIVAWMLVWPRYSISLKYVSQQGLFSQILSLALLVGDFVLLASLLWVHFQPLNQRVRPVLNLLSFSLLGLWIIILSDTYSWMMRGLEPDSAWHGVINLLSYWLFALAALRQVKKSPEGNLQKRHSRFALIFMQALPFMAVVFGYGLVIMDFAQYRPAPPRAPELLIGAGLLTVVVIARQMIETFENQHLNQELKQQLSERQKVEIALQQSEEKYRSVLNYANDAIVILQDDQVKFFNPQAARLTGYTIEEFQKMVVEEFIAPEKRTDILDTYQRWVRREKTPDRMETILLHRDGHRISVEINSGTMLYEGRLAILAVVRDITERKQAERLEQESHELTEALQTAGVALHATLDPDELMDIMLKQAKNIVDYDIGQILRVDDEVARRIRVVGNGHRRQGTSKGSHEIAFNIKDTPILDYMRRTRKPFVVPDVQSYPEWRENTSLYQDIRSWIGAPIIVQENIMAFISLDKFQPNFYSTKNAETLGIFANQASLAVENAQLFAEIRRLAITDPLTGLFNRRHFFDLADDEFMRCLRYGSNLSLIMFDVDQFKCFNDTYGHLAGDEVLREVALRTRECLRSIDLVGRYGGDELVVLLPETSLEAAATVAERLRKKIEQIELINERGRLKVTASLGVASIAENCKVIETLFAHADQALYRAKQAGRNRVSL